MSFLIYSPKISSINYSVKAYVNASAINFNAADYSNRRTEIIFIKKIFKLQFHKVGSGGSLYDDILTKKANNHLSGLLAYGMGRGNEAK